MNVHIVAEGPEDPEWLTGEGTDYGTMRSQMIIKILVDSCAATKPTEKHQ